MSTENSLMTAGQGSTDTASQEQGGTDQTTEQAGATGNTDPSQGEGGQQEQQSTSEGESAPQGAPESYAEFTLPEGVELTAEQLGEITALAKEYNLPQEQAQKLADTAAKMKQSAEAAMQARFAKGKEDWVNATRNDSEIGGDKLNESLSAAKKALDAFGSPELRQILDASGLGNHPDMIRAFARVGAAISEDRLVTGGTATSHPATRAADVLYGHMNKTK